MDEILQRYDFRNGTEKTRMSLEKSLQDVEEQDQDKSVLLSSLAVLQEKVCVEGYPSLNTHPGAMATIAMYAVSEAIKLIYKEKSSASEYHKPLLTLLLALLRAGTSTTNLELIYMVFQVSGVYFSEYFQRLKGDDVRTVLTLCRKEYSLKEKISYDEYADKVKHGMACILDEGFTDEQCRKYHKEFFDLYMYYRLDFLNCQPHVRKLMGDIAEWIYRKFDSRPLKGVKEKAMFVAYLERLKEAILAKNFPSDKEAVTIAEQGIDCFFEGVTDAKNLSELYRDIMEFLAALFIQKSGKTIHPLIKCIGSYFYSVDESHFRGKHEKIFDFMCVRLTEIVENSTDISLLAVRCVDAIVSEVLLKTATNSPSHGGMLVKLVTVLVKHPLLSTMHGAADLLREKSRLFKWKEHKSAAKEIFVSISKVQVPHNDDRKNLMDVYKDFVRNFLLQIKRDRLQQLFTNSFTQFVLGILEGGDTALYEIGEEIADEIEFDVKKNKGLIIEVFRRLNPLLEGDKLPWMSDPYLYRLTVSLTMSTLHGMKSWKDLGESDVKVMVSLVHTVMVRDPIHPHTAEAGSIFFSLYTNIAGEMLDQLEKLGKMRWAQPLFGDMVDLLGHTDERVREVTGVLVHHVYFRNGDLLSPYIDHLITAFLEHQADNMIGAIAGAYASNPGPVNKEFQKLLAKFLKTSDHNTKSHFRQLLQQVAKKHPEQFTEDNIKSLWTIAKKDPDSSVELLMTMENVAKAHPGQMGTMLPVLFDKKMLPPFAQTAHINVLKHIGLRSEEHAEAVIDYFAKTLDGREEQNLFLMTFDALKNVGGKHLDVLSKHKDLLVRVKKKCRIQYSKDWCIHIIDMIEGRSLAGVSEEVKDTRADVKKLEGKVTRTRATVKSVSKTVDTQKKEMNTVKKDVKTQDRKTGTLEKRVTETTAKVKQMDKKTLSHAPFWSHDVSKLLNPKSEHDWRLLSSRLGYSNDDIRGWAQQHDPCMAMLNEWYAVKKTSEASFAVLNALEEMNRMDAAAIVENAMKMAETVVEDEEFEYASPPAVFISYQWGMQSEVKLLKQHLEMAGYECWMDIGQMGGGDKLFEKIDKGIRGSKVIISCVTEKYAKSPNCNREVNLSVGLGRPIIPLLMEKQKWPPAGSMGPIFSEYLFIRFFTRPGEETGDQRYWSAAKFQELLMQLNYNDIVPDEARVQKEYKNWWTPVVEEIKIDKKKKDTGNQSQAKQTELAEVAAVSPDVFISYQWGKQKQIIVLYRRLTGLGYSCWMDIHQMGGGDSLYDKIDRGVRGCKLVLSCVTTKYSLSANCRREVSLADALKKPIVPLLLEKITWPPSGPMSMVLTQLLYINFSKDESVQDRWTGKEFDELVVKIASHIPSVKSSQPASPEGNNTSVKMSSEARNDKNVKHEKGIKKTSLTTLPKEKVILQNSTKGSEHLVTSVRQNAEKTRASEDRQRTGDHHRASISSKFSQQKSVEQKHRLSNQRQKSQACTIS